jgi:hypothetical protein
MRNWLVAAVVLLAVGLTVEVVYNVAETPSRIGIVIQGGDDQPQAQPAGESVPGHKRSRVAKADPQEVPEETWDDEDLPSSDLTVFLPPPDKPAPPDAIQTGTAKAQLESAFGEPTLKTATSVQRELREVYVFPAPDSRNVTFTQLSDGVVTTAYARTH